MTLSGSTNRTVGDLQWARQEARPYRLGMLAHGWRRVVWWYEPPTPNFIHEFVAQGERDGGVWEASSPISALDALQALAARAP